MNNKGFTIVELVAILLILAAIVFVSFPTIQNMAKSDNEKQYNNMINNLCLAGESYINANRDSFSELNLIGGETTLSIVELISYGNVKDDVKDPKTGESVRENSLKFTVLDDYSLNCQYLEN